MSIVIGVLSLLLTAAFLSAGGARLIGAEPLRSYATHLEVSPRANKAVGAIELAAAAGLIVGFWFRPAAFAASIGLVVLMVGTVVRHVRIGDPAAAVAPAATLGVLAVANAVLLGLAGAV
ncbi:DoxX family protein [Saccharomonospora sp. NPDC046836]|uniref:DoxX family protein n=1 Tax=Saccharomonospora sp. NPDC046836 TaxID=3156921 RepID=UPI0033F0A647